MSIKRMPIGDFVKNLYAAYKRKDGYIMGATGQDPKKWSAGSWWFTQYNGNSKQKAKALYWRDHAARVWDCNGLAEGLYKDYSGVDINTKARYNYAQWCDPKGSGLIPAKYRVPGAAVFWGSTASAIHHVGYLYKPVIEGKPSGDWYLIEARGVMYGVVMTRLNERKPNFWGWMTKYFNYSGSNDAPVPSVDDAILGSRILKNGMEGADVKALQTNLTRLGFECGSWGADGDFGDATEQAVRAFQAAYGLTVDGEFGPKSLAAMEKAMADHDTTKEDPKFVQIEGGDCYVRSAPSLQGNPLGIAKRGQKLPYQGESKQDERGVTWHLVIFDNKNGWVSEKYGRLTV